MKNYLALACLVTLFVSCSTDDNTTPEPEENFYALTVGNSWVYDHYRRTAPNSDIFENINVIDSVKIVGTEEIDGNTFFKFRTRTSENVNNIPLCSPSGEHFKHFRDSVGYLIDDIGRIHFSPQGDTDEYTFRMQPSTRLIFSLSDVSEVVNTPAGDFDCYWMNLYLRYHSTDERSAGTSKYYRMEEIGEVFTTTSFSNNPEHTIEKRLVSFNVQ
jgi:hypothetical protein